MPNYTGTVTCGHVADHLKRMSRVASIYWQLGMTSEYSRVMEVYNRVKAWYDANCP